MNPNDVAPMVITMVIAIGVALVLIFRGPIGRAIGRRIEGSGGGDTNILAARMEELEQRLAESEGVRARVAELEERLDFTERLMTQSAREAEIPKGLKPGS